MMSTSTPDYNKLLDQQTLKFIQQTDKWYPANAVDLPLDHQRSIYNKMCREFHSSYPENISATDTFIATKTHNIPVRRYTNTNQHTNTRIIYFHGGGFIVGGLDSHDDVCAELCDKTGFGLSSIDYRLAPEHLHPAAFEDALAGVLHESKFYKCDILLCGDSAGGNLAAAVSHRLRRSSNRDVNLLGQVLIYPALDSEMNSESFLSHANAPMLSAHDVNFYHKIRTGNNDVKDITSLAPLKDNDFTELPATVVFGAECDPLCDDGLHYCHAISNAGGSAQYFKEKGLVHGYLRARHSVDRARNSFKRIALSLSDLGN